MISRVLPSEASNFVLCKIEVHRFCSFVTLYHLQTSPCHHVSGCLSFGSTCAGLGKDKSNLKIPLMGRVSKARPLAAV